MSNAFVSGGGVGCTPCWVGGTINLPATRGPMVQNHLATYAQSRLTNDPIGTFTLTLQNIVVGSEYALLYPDGTHATSGGSDVAHGVASSSPQSITLDLYPAGNSYNTLTIRVRKGDAAPKYQPLETVAVAQAGTVTAYIAQVADSIA